MKKAPLYNQLQNPPPKDEPLPLFDAPAVASAPLYPPENFAQVFPGVYRSSFPKRRNFDFLSTIGIKTILTLMLEEYPKANMTFYADNHMRFVQFGVSGNKEPFVEIDEDMIRSALEFILDKRNHPLLIHCNKGKHRTGCLVGALRKTCRWALVPILEEYNVFAGSKPRFVDQQFIEFFDVTKVHVASVHLPDWALE